MSAEQNRELIRRLYTALDACDGDRMTACYRPDARFADPAFGELRGDEVGGMWRMLTSRATDLDVQLAEHDADQQSGSAYWIARYTFTATGREVENHVRAKFRFEDGLIADHADQFDFRAWAKQALGPAGTVIAAVPPLRALTRRRVRRELAAFMASERSA